MLKKPLALVILDGFGLREAAPDNAVELANKPNFDKLWQNYPHTQLIACGEAVGLPAGQMGNSEVGHLNIGAGRIVYQDISRISLSIKKGDFFENPAFLGAVDFVKQTGGDLHLYGLISDGGVHSLDEHYFALLELAQRQGVEKVYVHCFLDGRDTSPFGGKGYVQALVNRMKEVGVGRVATVAGRYYPMDRDKRWERTEKGYRAMVYGDAEFYHTDPVAAIQGSYDRGVTDEFVIPTVITNEDGSPIAKIKDGDAIIAFNFRADRMRQMVHVLTDAEFDGFDRGKKMDLHFVSMTQYEANLTVPIAFPPQSMSNLLTDVLEEQGLTQLRIAETEKYAHVTFFFNGGEDNPRRGEDRLLIQSPKVATYDLQPEMSAPEVTEKVLTEIAQDKYDVIILNYANCDMVGHTGIIPAAVTAVETVDHGLGQVVEAILAKGGALLITADHGNADMMIDPADGKPFTAHTTNPVPLIYVAPGLPDEVRLQEGVLADLAPTMLDILGIEQPVEMTGKSLIMK